MFNKADLACLTPVRTEEKDLLDAALARLRRGGGDRLGQAWVTSLATGSGTQEFMTGLATALKHRLVSLLCKYTVILKHYLRFNVFETDIRAHAPLIARERHLLESPTSLSCHVSVCSLFVLSVFTILIVHNRQLQKTL
jgi:hypothetical protein